MRNDRWRFGVSTPTKRWHDFSGLLHLIRVLKLKLSGYSSSFHLCRPSLSTFVALPPRPPPPSPRERGAPFHVPFAHTSTMQSRAFSVVGPLVWDGLPLALRSLPRVFSQKFLQQLKTTLFGRA